MVLNGLAKSGYRISIFSFFHCLKYGKHDLMNIERSKFKCILFDQPNRRAIIFFFHYLCNLIFMPTQCINKSCYFLFCSQQEKNTKCWNFFILQLAGISFKLGVWYLLVMKYFHSKIVCLQESISVKWDSKICW